MLGLLAISPDELVRRETIIDAIWGEDPPATAVNLVQTYVSRLRHRLDPDRPPRDGDGLLTSVGTGYRIRAGVPELDLAAFGHTVERARVLHAAGDPAAACGRYESALRLWRGAPLADIDLLRGHLAVVGLAGRRWSVVMEYAEVALATGRPLQVLPHLEALSRAEPLNERGHAQLMLALALAGRQAAALRAYEDLRQRLDDQLGVRPGPELARAHLRVLRQDLPAGRAGGLLAGGLLNPAG